jgi:hypothetical protein
MSKIGKYLLIFALVGAVAAAVLGFMVVQKRGEDAATLKQTQDAEASAQQSAKKAQAEAADLKAANDATTAKLADVTSTVDDLKTQLAAAKKSALDSATAVQTANDATAAIQAKLDAIMKTLNGSTADDLVQQAKKAQDDLTTAQSEAKILQDQAVEDKNQIAALQDAINRRDQGGKMPGVSGKVTFVDHAWNFVILDVGLSAGVVPNGELIVYRGHDFLGKVRVTKVDPNDSVAEILPDVKGDIQIGDSVLN